MGRAGGPDRVYAIGVGRRTRKSSVAVVSLRSVHGRPPGHLVLASAGHRVNGPRRSAGRLAVYPVTSASPVLLRLQLGRLFIDIKCFDLLGGAKGLKCHR